MNVMDLLTTLGGGNSVGEIGKKLNLGGAETKSLVTALGPALMRGLQKQSATPGGLESLTKALQSGGHQKYLDSPELMNGADAVTDGNKILGHIFGSKDVSRNVAANAAQSTGIDAGLIKKALPLLAGLAMGAVSKKSNAGQSMTGGLGSLLGMGDDDGFGLDDVLGLAKKFF